MAGRWHQGGRSSLICQAVLWFLLGPDDHMDSNPTVNSMLAQSVLILEDFPSKYQDQQIRGCFETLGNFFLKLLDGAALSNLKLLLLLEGLHSDFDDI